MCAILHAKTVVVGVTEVVLIMSRDNNEAVNVTNLSAGSHRVAFSWLVLHNQ